MDHVTGSNTKSDLDGEEFRLTDSFVAPWGLAHEERPLHYLWEGSVNRIQIDFVQPIDILEIYNISNRPENYIEEVEVDEGPDLSRLSISSDDLLTPGYLSAKFAVPELLEEPIVGQVVETKFHTENNEILEKDLTFTLRPMIRVVNLPDKIRLTDDEVVIQSQSYESGEKTMDYPGVIEAEMEQIGFGMAQVRAEAWGEGELLSEEESVYQDIAESLRETGFTTDDPVLREIPEPIREESTVEIPESTLRNVVEDFRKWLAEDALLESFDEDEINDMIEFVEAEDTDFDISAIYKHFEYLLLNSILDVVDRHPSNNVQMKSPQTNIEIESRVRSFYIVFKLSDRLDNEYESEAIEIAVEDDRETGGVAELELNTEWEEVQIRRDELRRLREEVQRDL